ncbi:putative Snf7 family, RNA-binding domain superfamily [Helianthus debilis subsp. tardiflorus]
MLLSISDQASTHLRSQFLPLFLSIRVLAFHNRLRIQQSDRKSSTSSSRRKAMSRVYVGNLDPRVSERELEDEFRAYGEKKPIAEIKRTAKTGNEAATKILARQLVRLRQQIANLQSSRAQMRGIATHTQVSAHSSVAVGMKGATKAMSGMNKEMAPAKQMKVMHEFHKQSAQTDITTEMMSEAIEDVLDDDEAEDETNELKNQESCQDGWEH